MESTNPVQLIAAQVIEKMPIIAEQVIKIQYTVNIIIGIVFLVVLGAFIYCFKKTNKEGWHDFTLVQGGTIAFGVVSLLFLCILFVSTFDSYVAATSPEYFVLHSLITQK